MMKFICELIIMSISGTVMYAFSVMLRRRKHAAMRYAMLTAAAVIMLVPFNLISSVPKLVKVELPAEISYSAGYAADIMPGAAYESTALAAVTAVWLIGALISAIGVIRNYIKTARILNQVTEESRDERLLDLYLKVCGRISVNPRAELRTSRYLNSPLLFGIIRPRIILPQKDFKDSELEMIIAHELVHYKHKDLWIALAASAAQCAHWFNPFAYFIGAAITETRELCCDEAVLALLEPEDKKEYGRVIISVIEDGLKRGLAYTTAMASPKSSIQKRLLRIARFSRPSRAVRLIGAAAVCACTVTSLTAFGFTYAAEAVPTQITQHIAAASRPSPKETPETEYEEQSASVHAASADTITDTSTEAPSYAESTAYPTDAPQPDEQYFAPEAETEQDIIDESYDYPAETERETSGTETEETMSDAHMPDITDNIPGYSFENETAGHTDYTESPDIKEQPKTFILPESAYVFSPDLNGNQAVRSDNFYASRDIKLTVSYNSHVDASISVYDADSGELLYDNGFYSYASSFSMQMPRGSTYYVSVVGECKNFIIFISGE